MKCEVKLFRRKIQSLCKGKHSESIGPEDIVQVRVVEDCYMAVRILCCNTRQHSKIMLNCIALSRDEKRVDCSSHVAIFYCTMIRYILRKWNRIGVCDEEQLQRFVMSPWAVAHAVITSNCNI